MYLVSMIWVNQTNKQRMRKLTWLRMILKVMRITVKTTLRGRSDWIVGI